MNRFQAAYDDAARALDLDPSSTQAWEAFNSGSFALERADILMQRLSRTFPANRPPWVRPLLQEAVKSPDGRRNELALRQ